MSRFNKVVTFLLVVLLFLGFTGVFQPLAGALSDPDLRFIPETIVLGSPAGESVVGQEFTVAVVIENIENLYGLDVKISWDTTYLAYVTHTVTIPVESYPDPIPPSPYPGTLHSPTIQVKDEVGYDYYWCSFASMAPAPSFNGSGTIFTMTFQLINQPWDYEIAPSQYLNLTIQYTYVKFVDKSAIEIPLTPHDGTVQIYARKFEYPPLPLLKVTPETIEGNGTENEFAVDVWLMGEGGADLDPFWDPGGFDIVLNFNTTLLEAVSVTVDPDGWFASFWPNPTITVKQEINNTAGTVWVVFFGYGEPHTPAYGKGRLFTVTFKEKLSVGVTPQISPIWLYNPRWYTASHDLHSLQGLIDLTAPEATNWMTLWPYGNPMTLNTWIDVDADGKLSLGDKLYMTDVAGKQLPYIVDRLTGTLNVTQLELNRTDVLDAFTPGNLSLSGPNLGVFSIHVTMANGTERYLTTAEYVEYLGEPVVNITVCLDSYIEENKTIGVDAYLDSWNGFNYLVGLGGVVFIEAHNETHTWNLTDGVDYEWYTYDNWWYLYPVSGLDRGDTLRIGYWAVSTVEVFYKTVEPDPLRYIEFTGTYDDFLTSLTNPINTNYTEVYPTSWRSPYRVVNWYDLDTSEDLTIGDQLVLEYINTGDRGIYEINEIATDMRIRQLGVICDKDPAHTFFGIEPDVKIAGVPHPERPMCPWHGEASSPLLPHLTESATYKLADETPPVIENVTQTPPPENVQPTDEVYVNATVTDDLTGVKNVTLWYRVNEGEWTAIPMDNLEGNIYNATIPAHEYCTTIEYYIEAYDNAGNRAISPVTEYYSYHVIPEYVNILTMVLTLLVLTIVMMMYLRKNRP